MRYQMLPIAFFIDRPPLPWQRNLGQKDMGLHKRFLLDFCAYRGFSGMRHRMLPIAFSPTDPRCHGNEIWDKTDYNSACVKDICEIFASIERFLGMGH